MTRRTRRWRAEPIDHGPLFVEATKREARRAGWPDAYRQNTGLLITPNRSKEAQDKLAAAAFDAKRAAHRRGNNPLWAVQSARTHALYYYHGDFWISTFQDEPPEQLMDGDEWYSPQEVREIVHGISPRRWDG